MLASELIDVLNKVKQVAGDVPIVLHSIEDDALTYLESVGVHIAPGDAAAAGRVELEHTATPTGVAPVAAEPPAPAA